MRTTRFAVSLLAVCAALAACKKNDAAADSAAAAESAAAVATGTPADSVNAGDRDLSDANVMGFLSSANSAEIAAGKMAQTKATNASVKAFAKMMVDDHTAMEKDGGALASRLSVTPMVADSGLIKDAADDTKELSDKKAGKDWDEDYLESQVDAHKKVLDYIDRAMNNAGTNADLKAMLQQARPKVEAHRARAEALKDSIK
jgi:putative membrane protein